jgi:hypothetical protein
MKQFKNLTLAIIAGLVVLSVATVSCKKKSGGTAAPTVATFSPTSAAVGDTITINGTGFSSPATVVIGGMTATTIISITSTTIKAIVPIGATTGSITVTVSGQTGTSTSNITITTVSTYYKTPDSLYTSSDQIGTTSLRAYWPFDGNSTEHFSFQDGTTISGGTTPTYVAGVRGQGISFNNSGLIYAPITALDNQDSMQHYTIAMWVNIAPNNLAQYPIVSGKTSAGKEISLFQVNGDYYNDIWGYAAVEIHSNTGYTGDTLGIGSEITQVDGRGPVTDDTLAVLKPRLTPSQYFGGANTWSFITVTYNDNTDSSKIYGNGQLLLAVKSPILNPPGFSGETFTLNDFSAPHNQVTFGTFTFSEDFPLNGTYTTGAPYGAPPASSTKPYWAHGMIGSLDEVRVYNNDLSASEINDLYLLGLHGK